MRISAAALLDANCRSKQTSKIAYDRLGYPRSRSSLPRSGDTDRSNSMHSLTALVATSLTVEHLPDQFERRFSAKLRGALCMGTALIQERA